MEILAGNDEALLVEQAISEPSAFGAIYDLYFSRIYSYTFYRLQDKQATEDVTAEIFEKALTNLKRYNPKRAPFAAWLFAIARNSVNDYLRAKRTRRHSPLETTSNQLTPDIGLEATAILKEEHRQLLVAFSTLDDRSRDILSLKFASELTNRQIAKLTGISESNVGIIVFRAMQKLRKQLLVEEGSHEG